MQHPNHPALYLYSLGGYDNVLVLPVLAFVVESIEDLREVLTGAKVPSPRMVSGAFLRAGKQAGGQVSVDVHL